MEPMVTGVEGKDFAQIAHENSIETKPSYNETIPETVSLDQLKNNAMASLHGQYGDL